MDCTDCCSLNASFSREAPGSLTFRSLQGNDLWWLHQVFCVFVQEVADQGQESESVRYYGIPLGPPGQVKYLKMERVPLAGPPDIFLKKWLDSPLTGYIEYRQRFWSFQPQSWLTYHNFSILEVDYGKLVILAERVSDKLELMIGEGALASSFMREYRSTGQLRNIARCSPEPYQRLMGRTTLLELLRWFDGPVARSWQPYNLLSSNCQHFQDALHGFLLTAGERSGMAQDRAMMLEGIRQDFQKARLVPKELLLDPSFVLAAVQQNWRVLLIIPEVFRSDLQVMSAAVNQDGFALQYGSDGIRNDKDIVLTAVKQNGDALQFASEILRQDVQVILAAVKERGSALQFAPQALRIQRELMLWAVRLDGMALRYVGYNLQRDRQVVSEAVRQCGAALRYAAPELRDDMQVLWNAMLSDPSSLVHAFG